MMRSYRPPQPALQLPTRGQPQQKTVASRRKEERSPSGGDKVATRTEIVKKFNLSRQGLSQEQDRAGEGSEMANGR